MKNFIWHVIKVKRFRWKLFTNRNEFWQKKSEKNSRGESLLHLKIFLLLNSFSLKKKKCLNLNSLWFFIYFIFKFVPVLFCDPLNRSVPFLFTTIWSKKYILKSSNSLQLRIINQSHTYIPLKIQKTRTVSFYKLKPF